jgi:exosortase/archaeosortase
VDDSVAVVVEKCIPTNPPLQLAGQSYFSQKRWALFVLVCGFVLINYIEVETPILPLFYPAIHFLAYAVFSFKM